MGSEEGEGDGGAGGSGAGGRLGSAAGGGGGAARLSNEVSSMRQYGTYGEQEGEGFGLV